MKNKNLINLLATILFVAILTSCGSPEKDGGKLGMSFVNCLGNSNDYKQSYLLIAKKDSCTKAIKEEWSKSEEKYKNDAEKWKIFVGSFENATQKTLDELNTNLSKLIASEISEKLWVKEDEKTKDYYICLFDNGTLKFLNSKGEFDYKLNGNAIVFDDIKKTSGIITVKDEKLILSNPEQNSEAIYRLADDKDKLIGKWYAQGVTLIFSRNGSCTFGFSGRTKTTSYTFDNNTLNLKGVFTEKFKTDNWNSIYLGKDYCSRIKNPKPDNLKFLFAGKKE